MIKPFMTLESGIRDCKVIITMPAKLMGSVYSCCIEIPNTATISNVDFLVRETESDYPEIRIIEKYA